MPYAPLLSHEEVQQGLRRLDAWELDGARITRLFLLPAFADSIAFVNKIADLAEAADHHPDITISFKRVTVSVTTYASGGLTHKDLDLAQQIDRLFGTGDPAWLR